MTTPGGDDDAHLSFEGWYREVHPRVVTAVRLMTGESDLALEAADEALVRAFERWDRVSRMESPRAWTVRVAINVAHRRLRRRAVEQRLLLRHRVSTQFEPEPTDPDLWSAVAMLAERQRTAIVLRYVADLKEEEIASVMGVGRSTVSTTLRDARSRLEALLNIDERADQDETEASDARPA